MLPLELKDLTAGHNTVPAVRRLSLTVEPGEIVALLGPNGAGKTTTLDTACGLLPSLGGEVHMFGRRVRRLTDASKQRLAYVPEHRGIFRQLTVEENLRLRARSHGAVDTIYQRFPTLAGLRGRKAGLLSGGEQQLLALVCALALEPKLLFIDEMTMGLAPTVVHELAALVKDVASRGVAILFVEQHVHLALEICDRAYLLSHGDCVLDGSGTELLSRVDELSTLYLAGDPSTIA